MKKVIIIMIGVILIAIVTIILWNKKINIAKDIENSEKSKNYVDNEISNQDENEISKELKEYYDNMKYQTIEKVSISINPETVTKTGLSFCIVDTNKSPYTCTKEYRIEKKENEQWKPVPLIVDGWLEEAISFRTKDGIIQETIDWKDKYGELEKGEYRLIKFIGHNSIKLYAEFNIE